MEAVALHPTAGARLGAQGWWWLSAVCSPTCPRGRGWALGGVARLSGRAATKRSPTVPNWDDKGGEIPWSGSVFLVRKPDSWGYAGRIAVLAGLEVYSILAEVRVQEGEPLENALRRFKRKVQTEDIIKEVKRHSFYLKPGEKKRVKEALARKRNRRRKAVSVKSKTSSC